MKQKLYILLMAALLPVCAAAQGVDLNRGLVAYYPFEGNANDASGNGNNGRPEGATLAQGIVGQCYHFGGVDNSQIIRVPNSTSLQFSTAATFAFWFKLDDYMGMDGYGKKVNNGHMKFFAKDFDRGQICSGINGVGNGKFRVEISNNRNGCEATINGNPTSNWYHAVMVVTTSYFKIYINGEKVATKNLAMNFNESNSKDLIIGRLAQTWYPFHGCIDEFRVYNRELNDNEVSALSRGITGNGGTGELARRQEEMRQRNAAKLECVGKTIYWNEEVSFDISSGNEGLIGGLISSALGTNKVTYNVRYYAIVEANLGQTAVKCVISNVEIQDPSYASVNYVKYKKSAYATLCEDIGKTRVKQLNEFEIR